MLGCEVFVESYTHAQKAQKLLENHGRKSSVRRSSGENGCGYILTVKAECSAVSDILTQGGISHRSLRNSGGYR